MGCKVSDEYEVPEYWEELTEEGQEKELERALQDFLSNEISANVWVEVIGKLFMRYVVGYWGRKT